MKHWHETATILARVAALSGPAALATVVRISGSAYRRPGAKLLIEASGESFGGISGGCLESDVRAQALEVLQSGAPRLLHYDTGSDEETLWGLGLGCEGAVDIYVQRVGADWPLLAEAQKLVAAAAPFAPITVIAGPHAGATALWAHGALAGTTGAPELDLSISRVAMPALERDDAQAQVVEVGPHRAFVDLLQPAPPLVIFGAGDDAQPLAALAAQAGFDVTVVDHRPAFLTAKRFPPPAKLVSLRSSQGVEPLGLTRRHFAVVQTHAMQHDRAWMSALSAQPLAYLGLLGPQVRRLQVLRDLPVTPEKLYAPVGLDLGADGPEQVAISIVAEMLAVHAHREPGHLRARNRGIHDP